MIILAGDCSMLNWGFAGAVLRPGAGCPKPVTMLSTISSGLSFRRGIDNHMTALRQWMKDQPFADYSKDWINIFIEDTFVGMNPGVTKKLVKVQGALEYIFSNPVGRISRFHTVPATTWQASLGTAVTNKVATGACMAQLYGVKVNTEHEGDALGIFTFAKDLYGLLNSGLQAQDKYSAGLLRYAIRTAAETDPRIQMLRKPADHVKVAEIDKSMKIEKLVQKMLDAAPVFGDTLKIITSALFGGKEFA